MGTPVVAAIVLGLAALVVRYRQQQNRLLRVIVREGGLYLFLTLGKRLNLPLNTGRALLTTAF